MAEKFSKQQLDALLKLAGKQLGTDPESLKRSLENGNTRQFADQSGNDMLKKALADPALAARLLRSPQAKAILKKLTED